MKSLISLASVAVLSFAVAGSEVHQLRSAAVSPPLPPRLASSGSPLPQGRAATPAQQTHSFPAPPLPDVNAAPQPARQPSIITANTISAAPMTLSFDVQGSAQPLQGSILRGKGFRVWADWQSGPYGTLRFYFQQLYRGLPLNEWSGGSGYPGATEGSVSIELPAPDAGVHRVHCTYNLHTIQLGITGSSGVLTNFVQWRDNMTDALGTNGPDTVVIDHPAISNVAFTPATPLPPSPYVWEGVIGNTSQEPVGPGVHAPWWPILKMVSRGTNVFYTGGYNEGKWDVQKFDVHNPQFVLTNFSAAGRKQIATPWPVDMTFFDDSTLLVKYSDSNVVAFDALTTAKLAEHLPDWTNAPVGVPTADSSAVAVNPNDNNTVAVYYHTTDQVVVYTNATNLGGWATNFVIGIAGGYGNGPSVLVPTNTIDFRQSVKLSGFYYDSDGTTNADARITNAVLCFQSDGKLWVGDTLTSRMLRFDTAGLCDAWFMFVAHTYTAYVDPNDPSRVFAGALEFAVDYTNVISNCWTLKNCWTRYDTGAELERGNTAQNGIFCPVTLTNNGVAHTLALMREPGQGNARRLVELTANGVRPTYLRNQSPLMELDADGSSMTMSVGPTPQTGTTALFYRDAISSWAGADPIYARSPAGIVDYTDNVCPIYWGSARLRGSKLFLFYPSRNQFERDVPAIPFTGCHIGAVDLSQSGAWQWLNSPTGPLDGKGTFETNCNYAGSGFTIVDDNIFFFYRGEGWRGGQANQIFHYKTDGRFVGQFGTPNFVQGTLLNGPGVGANCFNISGVKVNGTIYLYTSDEWSHGIHRWRIDDPTARTSAGN